ncbi:hypothetical protein OHC33_006515 [Knufia fluminis]|uniref:FCP1 homology domain-containing protein n=1 Tax=Knufia fluminis TaxID=191047 RepID=A0AAN8I3A6_9EURO|nr:hypothetical protein OHC33_006515 [Knufia fluminis]
MSSNAIAQPVTGTASSLAHAAQCSDVANTSEKNTVEVPPRSTSQQPGSSIPQPLSNVDQVNEPPSPRRGSKRSLISRSRQGSRSSRRSARHAAKALESRENPPAVPQNDSARPERKQKSGGFLSFLNCCRADEDLDALKSEEPDVPAKQRKIEPTPQRAAIPDEPAEPVASEKMKTQEPQYNEKQAEPITVGEEQPVLSEKSRQDSRPRVGRNELSHDKPAPEIAPVSVPSASAITTGQPDSSTQAGSSRQAEPTVHDLITAPQSEPIEPYAADQKPHLEFPPPPKDERRESDVDMTDVPSVPPVEEQNVVDEPVQPHDIAPVALPPPPPLQKRMAQTQTPVPAVDVPPVPDSEPESKQQWLLPPAQPPLKGRKCLILDLDETLVHSSFKILNQADFTIPVEIEGQYHNVYVIKRPGVDQFMKRVGELYEVVVFTASVSKYGDPLLDQLDIHHVVHHRLFRESCYNHQGNYVKDLSQVGRDLKETIIIDNSPTSYIFHPQHAVPISSWFSDAHDNELLDLIPVLEDLAGSQVQDVSLVLDVAL